MFCSGVRISWLMLAMNVVFARLASSAAAFARASSSSDCRFSETSRAIIEMPTARPVRSQIGDVVTDSGIRVPSLRIPTVSKSRVGRLDPGASRRSPSPRHGSSGKIVVTGLPTMASASYPNSCAAPRFQWVTAPSSVAATIASCDCWTMAARCARSASLRRRSLMSCMTTTTLSLPSKRTRRALISTASRRPSRATSVRSRIRRPSRASCSRSAGI